MTRAALSSDPRRVRTLQLLSFTSFSSTMASHRSRTRQDPVSCTFCRVKKLKCSREHPCSNCKARGVTCSFQVSPINGGTPAPAASENADILNRLQRLEALVLLGNSNAKETYQNQSQLDSTPDSDQISASYSEAARSRDRHAKAFENIVNQNDSMVTDSPFH